MKVFIKPGGLSQLQGLTLRAETEADRRDLYRLSNYLAGPIVCVPLGEVIDAADAYFETMDAGPPVEPTEETEPPKEAK